MKEEGRKRREEISEERYRRDIREERGYPKWVISEQLPLFWRQRKSESLRESHCVS